MHLKISLPKSEENDRFCSRIIQILKKKSLNLVDVDAKLIEKLNDYLKEIFNNPQLVFKKIVKEYFQNQIFYEEDSNYFITVDRNSKYPNTELKLDSLAHLIEFGNIDMKGYPIFSKIYSSVDDSIDILYLNWRGF